MDKTQVNLIANFEEFTKKVILNHALSIVVFVDQRCNISIKQLESIKSFNFGDECAFWWCDVHDSDDVARNNRISIAPTVIGFRNGQKLWEDITFTHASVISARIQAA